MCRRCSALLDQGASPNARNRLGDTPLNTAARNGNLELVRLLLERGADVDQPNLARVTPLMSAAYGGHEAIVRELLAHKADVNASRPHPQDGDGLCGGQRQRRQRSALLDAGVDPNQRDAEGATALMWAAAYGKHDNVKLLLERGAEVNARDARGKSALAIATEQKQDEAVQAAAGSRCAVTSAPTIARWSR